MVPGPSCHVRVPGNASNIQLPPPQWWREWVYGGVTRRRTRQRLEGLAADPAEGSAGTGRTSRKVLPRPNADSTSMRPPCASAIRREIARPSPVPGNDSASGLLDRWNVENRWLRSTGEMPIPVSATVTCTHDTSRATTTLTRPPLRVYFTALPIRLLSTVPISSASPETCTGAVGRSKTTRDSPGVRLLAQQLDRGVSELDQIDLPAYGPATLLHLGVVEEVLDQPVEAIGVAPDRGDRARPDVDVLEQLDVADDRGQRGLELVGDRGDQLALVAVELTQLRHQTLLGLEQPGAVDHACQLPGDLGDRGQLVGPEGLVLVSEPDGEIAETSRSALPTGAMMLRPAPTARNDSWTASRLVGRSADCVRDADGDQESGRPRGHDEIGTQRLAGRWVAPLAGDRPPRSPPRRRRRARSSPTCGWPRTRG